MADEMVLATQQWLNKTYAHIPEFDKCPEDGTQVSAEWRVQVFLRRDTVEETQPNDISAYNMLLNVSNIVAEASDEVNLIRIFETFASMNAQTPDNYSHTIAAGE
ncbi:hypothetical protein [Lactococcus ileimucosae]|uniref:hypothetical protein n=1 Tax=Lactococcus ileimucosae TaxID=2941329 RepID=UPI0035160868